VEVGGGRLVRTGDYDRAQPLSQVPLPPGRYVVQAPRGPGSAVEIKAHQWLRLGVMKAAPCGRAQ
jgi:hypothetical protein